MKKIFYLSLFLPVIFSCSKSSNTTTTGTGPATAIEIKTQVQLTYAQQNAAHPYDSTLTSFTYDSQNRMSSYNVMDWNSSTGSTIATNYQVKIVYGQGTITYSTYPNGGANAFQQVIYYPNSSTSLTDSATHQAAINNVPNTWYTFEKEKYSYLNGYANTADTTIYNITDNSIARTNHSSYIWSNGDLLSLSTQGTNGTSYSTYTYYTVPPAVVVTGLSGPFYVQRITLTSNYPKTLVTSINGNAYQSWTYTYTTDNLNRIISTKWIVSGPSFPNFPYILTSFTYY